MNRNRLARVLEQMQRSRMDQLLISDPMSICYLGGWRVSPGERFWALWIAADGEVCLFSNPLYALGETGVPTRMLTDGEDVAQCVSQQLRAGTVGVDKNLAARFLLPLMQVRPELTFVLGSQCVDCVRSQKDEDECRRMRIASQINDQCMEKLVAFLHDGVTERACADYLKRCYDEYGCSGFTFSPIVSFGANGADPHHRADDTVLRDGDGIVIDIGCIKDGYCSDMTRSFFWKRATERQLAVHALVREAGEKAQAAVRPGVALSELDKIARDHIASAGYGENFTHRLGHFIGIEAHEQGDVSSTSPLTAQPGMIFSIEPGVYLPGQFGVRIEDLVLVTQDGFEILNHVPRDRTVIGAD